MIIKTRRMRAAWHRKEARERTVRRLQAPKRPGFIPMPFAKIHTQAMKSVRDYLRSQDPDFA